VLKKRLIPVVLLRNGVVVQSKGFQRYQRLGNPVTVVQRLTDWAADELIYLDISRDNNYDLGRDDLNTQNRKNLLEILRDVAQRCYMPLTFGGGIRSVYDAACRITAGADKISINSRPLEAPNFITECAKEFGSQCVVVSIDAIQQSNEIYEVVGQGGKLRTGRLPTDWAREAEARGAGEILINSVDRDGKGTGFDLKLIQSVANAVRIPVIALGGAGKWEDFNICLNSTNVSAVAAANIFHYTENSVFKAKEYLIKEKANVRAPSLGVITSEGLI
jgi:cyclase